MALSLANVSTMYRGPRNLVYAEATFDSSYAASGESLNAVDVGLVTIDNVWVADTAGYHVQYDKSTDAGGALRIWVAGTPDTNSALAAPIESSTGRNVATVVVSLLIVGR